MKSKDFFKRLLAKSLAKREDRSPMATGAATYTGHIEAVMQSAEVLLQQLGSIILKQLGLDSIDRDYFANTVRLGAYLHDWGKANQHFQEMVYLKSQDENIAKYRKKLQNYSQQHGDRQMLRHEVISGILALRVPSFRAWLAKYPQADFMAAVWAAMGHHLKIGIEEKNKENHKAAAYIARIPNGTGSELEIYTHHADFQALLRMGQKLGLPAELPEPPPETWTKKQLKNELKALLKEFVGLENQIIKNKDWERQKFIAAVKATVIAADLAGSALPAVDYSLKDWIAQVLDLVLSATDIERLMSDRLEGKTLYPFQKEIAQTPHRVTLVKAGCGSGKTVGAYAWAQKWAVGRKLFFGYPTTGTASQGYQDYAAETEIEGQLMHSRAQIDLEDILFSYESDGAEASKASENSEGSEDSKANEDVEDIRARLAAFDAWQAKLIVCTVDSVLGLIQNSRKPLFSWPAISQSAFVFDEVHAYDDRLFGALLRFLETFRGAPILLMSASFSEGQLDAIRQVMEKLGEKTQVIDGPQNLEIIPRYQIQSIGETSQIWRSVLETLEKRQKVLWVTNSVQTCIDLYREAETKISEHFSGVPCDLPVRRLIYHSRYRYQDRLEKHKAVIDAFKSDEPVLAITTQVCEMSLDLSADLLVSAMAPAAALIQRLGRLNRRIIEDEAGIRLASGRICSALVYPWDSKKPYSREELDTGKQLVEQLGGKEISQQDLAEVAASLNSTTPTPVKSQWLEGHWCAYRVSLREPGYTITVLLEQDLGEIRKAADKRKDKSFMKEAQRWSVPIRIMDMDFQEWRRIGFYPVAPPDKITYSQETGAEPCKK